jgi:hypothetical protein
MPYRHPFVRAAIEAETRARQAEILAERMRTLGALGTCEALLRFADGRHALAIEVAAKGPPSAQEASSGQASERG